MIFSRKRVWKISHLCIMPKNFLGSFSTTDNLEAQEDASCAFKFDSKTIASSRGCRPPYLSIPAPNAYALKTRLFSSSSIYISVSQTTTLNRINSIKYQALCITDRYNKDNTVKMLTIFIVLRLICSLSVRRQILPKILLYSLEKPAVCSNPPFFSGCFTHSPANSPYN